MSLHLIDTETWPRREHYRHYMEDVRCGYSLTVNLDISRLAGQKLYPAMLWLLTRSVNAFAQFRTVLTPDGPGVYDDMHPSYTLFNRQRETFCSVWTAFDPQYPAFLQAYAADVRQYASSGALFPKPQQPANTFDVSMLPWVQFSSFNLNLFGGEGHLLPIFTLGKFFTQGEKRLLPLAVQVHHAVCDGYHVGRFLEHLQAGIDSFPP